MKTFDKIFQDKDWFNVSNILTTLRLLLAPAIVWGVYNSYWLASFFILFVGAATDVLDGYFARRFNEQTHLGTMLDPIADKVFLIALFFSLAFINTPSFRIPFWFVWLLVTREAVMLVGGAFLLTRYSEFEIRPTVYGKSTTFFQLTFIVWIFACYFFNWLPVKTYNVVLILLAIYSVMSLSTYVRVAWARVLKS